jgi:hypothetical protein
MNKQDVKKILEDIAAKRLEVKDGMNKLADLPYLDIGCANLDMHRPLRNGFSEVVYGQGKSFDQICEIVNVIDSKGFNLFGTRVDREKGEKLNSEYKKLNYDEVSKTFQLIQKPIQPLEGEIAICCAGTADVPVAEEAFKTSIFFGAQVKRYYDVGVAGLHRLIDKANELKEADVIIVVAGMEGALPSVVGGIFAQPIIAVPTSIGYGVNLSGITTLLAMLSSCAEGIVAVNIDNGFGAACSAIRILNSTSNNN